MVVKKTPLKIFCKILCRGSAKIPTSTFSAKNPLNFGENLVKENTINLMKLCFKVNPLC